MKWNRSSTETEIQFVKMLDSLTFIKHSSTKILISSKIEIDTLTNKESFSDGISISLF